MESSVSHNRRAIRSISATAHRSSSRSDSSSPFRRAGSGLLSVLRQKFSIRIARGDGESSRYHGNDPDSAMATGTSATLCSSWRSRPRHVDKPIRPAYSDECLSCCGRSTCLRNRNQHHRHQTSQEMTRFDQPSHRAATAAAAVPSTSRKVVGIVICKHCHAKNDRSPSDFEMSQDVSQSEEEKVTAKMFFIARYSLLSDFNFLQILLSHVSNACLFYNCTILFLRHSENDISLVLAKLLAL